MKRNLTLKETILISSMVFGMFFGAGNLIFPIYMGQLAGKNVLLASVGFLITGVGLPLLAIAALGKSHSSSLYDLGLKVSKKFSIFFTCILYLSIGPFFAIPRCATTSFTVGIAPLLGGDNKLALFIFSLIFFIFAAYFSLKSNKIMHYIGKILNPIFLFALFILLFVSLLNPLADYSLIEASGSYMNSSFLNGFYEGYNTMDALAGLAFGIVIITVIRDLGISSDDDVARNTIKAGFFACIMMGLIYFALAFVGATSPTVLGLCSNGGEVLSKLAQHYFGDFGAILLAIIVTMACLKTVIGLIISCSETFASLFNNKISQKTWSIIFIVVSFLIANLGLNQIISISVPVLMFSYPIAMVLIFTALCKNLFNNNTIVYKFTIYTSLLFAFLELIKSLPFNLKIVDIVRKIVLMLPLGEYGLEWLIPSLFAFVVSTIYVKVSGVLNKN